MTTPYFIKAIGNVFSDWKLLQTVVRRKYVKYYLPLVIAKRQAHYVEKLRKKDHVNVVFLPMNVAMWKYQHLYELLKEDKRFHVYIFLTPATTFTKEQRIEDLKAMRTYFDGHNMEYVDFELEAGKSITDIRSLVDPDILFYTQPVNYVVDDNRNYTHFYDKLLCYAPYGFLSRNADFLFKELFETIAWKLYFPTELNRKLAIRLNRNKDRNVVVVGYTGADDYFTQSSIDVWKVKDRRKKRIIWAPHFTIIDDIGIIQSSYFLEMAKYMRELAIEYADRVTIAFKPHPRLFSELCIHPEWGEGRAKEYYDFWEKNENAQLEMGDFIDLFKGSDALIHDSGSFTVDYLYFHKPVLYDNPNIEEVKNTADELGKQAYDAHYKVKSLSDIKAFIDEVVLGGNDTMASVRKEFFNVYLKPKDGKTASQFIYDDIVNSIWG